MTVHFQVSLPILGWSLVATIVSLVAFSYTSCVNQHHCQKFLPSISATWVYPPENYVSRWVVGIMSMLMGLVQYAIFRFDQTGLTPTWNKAILVMGLTACVGLSWVGSICCSTGATCRGNGSLHGISAAIFFIFYNLDMIILTIKKPDPVARRFEAVMVAGSVLSKLRFSTTVTDAIDAQVGGNPWNEWIGGLVEWADVLLVALWTASYVTPRGKDYRLGIVNRNTDSTDTPATLDFFSMAFTQILSVTWFLGALIIPAIFYKAQGRWPKGGIPYISDTWVYPPGNWISRWADVSGAALAAATHVCAYYLEKDSGDQGKTVQGPLLTILAVVALFGGSVVGCVDESENGTIHGIAATTFFAGYDVFMVCIAYQLCKNSKDCVKSTIACIASLISIATKVRFLSDAAGLVSIYPYIAQALEWTDAAVIIVFLVTYIAAFGDRTKNIGVALYKLGEKQVALCPEAP